MNRFWTYNALKNKYFPAESEALSQFPTIIDPQKKIVFCRQCHRWEYITGFSRNLIKTQCGKIYTGPFMPDHSYFNYGYDVDFRNKIYYIRIKSQAVSTTSRRLFENDYELDLNRKVLYRDGKPVFEHKEVNIVLCKELTAEILATMGADYKAQFGIQPTVASSFTGFNLLIGYMLCPFNINFYQIAQHWGLNPYDAEFSSLSSSDTPNAENEMFSSMGIKPTKALRKMYQKYPQSVICYAAAQDMGFTDVNLLQKTPSVAFYCFLKYLMISFAGGTISYNLRNQLKNFITDMRALANQKTVWNSIERTVGYMKNKTVPQYIITDGITTYGICRDHLTDREKKEILHEGFNTYTHDFLVRRQNELYPHNHGSPGIDPNENITFKLEDEFLALEYKAGDNKRRKIGRVAKGEDPYEEVPDKDRFCFYVARDSATLRTIGSEMSNCVGWGYADAVKDRRATIVYAKYKGQYSICIEVTPQFTIRQAFGPHNNTLAGAAFQAYHEWCTAKKIVFTRAFGVHCAPM